MQRPLRPLFQGRRPGSAGVTVRRRHRSAAAGGAALRRWQLGTGAVRPCQRGNSPEFLQWDRGPLKIGLGIFLRLVDMFGADFLGSCFVPVSVLNLRDGVKGTSLDLTWTKPGGLHAFDRGHILFSTKELYFEVLGQWLGHLPLDCES